MASKLPVLGIGVSFGVTLLMTSALLGAWGRADPVVSQEIPTAVTSELVDEALTHRLDPVTVQSSADPRSAPPASLLLLVPVSLALLISLGLLRADRPWQHSPWRYSSPTTDAERAHATPAPPREHDPEDRRGSYSRPAKPKEELQLPPHVLAMLGRGADPSQQDEEGEPKRKGVDLLVPRLDRRTGS